MSKVRRTYAADAAISRERNDFRDRATEFYEDAIKLRTQLSAAAEARLVKAGEWMGHNGSCMGALLGKPDCDCGLQAFLEGL